MKISVSTSGNLNRTSVREKPRSVFYLPIGFSELFDDISLVKREKIMRGCE